MSLCYCPACDAQVPEEAKEARFCVNCGLPVSQICPYEERSDPKSTRLMLRLENRRPPAVCSDPICGGLLKSCERCGRLHRLEDTVCRTPRCPGALRESSEAFASGSGPLEGTRAVTCRGKFVTRAETLLNAQDVEMWQQMAYRYGLLVGVTGRSLSAYRWDGAQWKRRGQPLALSNEELRPRSLLLDEGRAFILTDTNALIVSLDTLMLERTETEDCILQAKGGPLWGRIGADSAGRSLLLLTNCHTWQTRRIVLPCAANTVTDMVIGDAVTIATRVGTLLSVAPDANEAEEIAMIPGAWQRLALTPDRLIALGSDEAHRSVLLGIPKTGQKEGPYTQAEGYLPDLIAQEERLYLYKETTICACRTDQLSQRPAVKNLPAGQENQTGGFVISDSTGDHRLLLRRVEGGGRHYLYLVNALGELTQIGHLMLSAPLVCVADSRLVVACREGIAMKLRTYALGEE